MDDKWLVNDGKKLQSRIVLTIAAYTSAKLLGFVRLQQIAATIGVSAEADILLIVFQLSWFIETVFVSGAVIPLLISTVYQVEKDHGGEEAVALFLHTAFVCILGSLVFGIAINLFSAPLAAFFAPNLDSDGEALFVRLLLVSSAVPFALALSHFLSLVNRLLENGVWYSIPLILTNAAAILSLLLGYSISNSETAAMFMMAGLCLGALVVCGIQIFAIPVIPRRKLWAGLWQARFFPSQYPGVSTFWYGVFVLVIATLINEIYVYVDFYFASRIGEGNVAALGYASRLARLVNSLLVAAAMVILEPRWANAVATNKSNAWREVIQPDSIALISMLAAPVAALFFYPSEVTDLIYRSGSLDPEPRSTLNAMTKIYAIGALAICTAFVTMRAVVIAGRHRWVVVTAIVALILKVVASIHLIPIYGVSGLVIATVLSFAAQTIGNLIILYVIARIPLPQASAVFRLLAVFAVVFMFGGVMQRYLAGGAVELVAACGLLAVANVAVALLFGFGYHDIFKFRMRRH